MLAWQWRLSNWVHQKIICSFLIVALLQPPPISSLLPFSVLFFVAVFLGSFSVSSLTAVCLWLPLLPFLLSLQCWSLSLYSFFLWLPGAFHHFLNEIFNSKARNALYNEKNSWMFHVVLAKASIIAPLLKDILLKKTLDVYFAIMQ